LMRWLPPNQWAKIKLVRCGLDAQFLNTEAPSAADVPRLVCVGRLCIQKAQFELVAAARRLRDSGTNFEIVLVGDGPMRPLIEEAIKQNGLTDRISITGWVSGERVHAEMTRARVLVLPSFSEDLPVVIMESMALGRPVISTYVAGIPEIVQPGKNGWLVPASDEIALADAVNEALTTPVEQLAKMGAAGREYVREYHSAAKEAAKMKELFETVIHGSSGSPRS
jgi:glycosyltransferase involved in cell wall biosynthesis